MIFYSIVNGILKFHSLINCYTYIYSLIFAYWPYQYTLCSLFACQLDFFKFVDYLGFSRFYYLQIMTLLVFSHYLYFFLLFIALLVNCLGLPIQGLIETNILFLISRGKPSTFYNTYLLMGFIFLGRYFFNQKFQPSHCFLRFLKSYLLCFIKKIFFCIS